MALRECPCGSGEYPRDLKDARGIFCCYVCDKCEDKQRAKYRPEIFDNANYEADDLGDDSYLCDDEHPEDCTCADCEPEVYDHDDEDVYGYNRNMMFADPGGESSLRAASPDNPRNLPCPECGAENMLTPADRALGYRCDECANRAERGW